MYPATTLIDTDKSPDRRPLRLREAGVWIPLAYALARRGVTPNGISRLGLAAGLASGALLALTPCVASATLARGLWLAAVAAIALRGACNILDGVMAVETGQSSPLGLLWNEVPDRITDAATLIGAGYALGGEPALGWAAALVATLVSYVRVQCRIAGAPMDYCGPMAKPMRMIVVSFAALWMAIAPAAWISAMNAIAHGAMTLALAVVVAGGVITFARRLSRAARALAATTEGATS
jgi:phosphatidylglycerophosphate synthase